MNKKNLLRMADYIETIPQSKFDMKYFRNVNDHSTIECNSIGCVIGHCIVLDTPENIDKFRLKDGEIYFIGWSKYFTGLKFRSSKWCWCFSGEWRYVDNTPTGAARRIRYLVENGLPYNWAKQMLGCKPLLY